MRGAHSERKPVRREFGLVWGHGHVHMNGRTCSFVRAGAVRMCIVLVRGLGMGLRTPYRTGCTAPRPLAGGVQCPGWKPGEGGGAMCAPLLQPVCGGRLYAGPPPQPGW